MTRHAPSQHRPAHLLNHILDQPGLVEIIQNLDTGVLARLIEHIGLEDCAEIVAMTTVEQLRRLFDIDLWRDAAPGHDERFDADRFCLWLEVMLEAGPAFAASKIAQLDEDLVVLALCKQLLVIDLDELALSMSQPWRSDEEDLIDKELESCLGQEFEQYLVIARHHRFWEPILTLLLELNEHDFAFLVRLLERCCRISAEYIEDNGGLYRVLTGAQMIESDLAAEREERRRAEGFVAPAAAAAFLSRPRGMAMNRIATAVPDPATRDYFRALHTRSATGDNLQQGARSGPERIGRRVANFLEVLHKAQVIEDTGRRWLIEDGPSDRPGLPVSQAMQLLRLEQPELYSVRLEELSYLANVLISGCAYRDRRFRPIEAAQAAVSTANLGAEHLVHAASAQARHTIEANLSGPQAAELMRRHSLMQLFNTGWRLLHTHVAMYTARGLAGVLMRLEKGAPHAIAVESITVLRVALQTCTAAGRPWLFQNRLDELLGILDGAAVAELGLLLHEYPLLPDTIPIPLRRPESPCIANRRQILGVHALLKRRGMAGRAVANLRGK